MNLQDSHFRFKVTSDKKLVILSTGLIPVEIIVKEAPGSFFMIEDGQHILYVPFAYNVENIIKRYIKNTSNKDESKTEVYECYNLTRDKKYVAFMDVDIPVNFIIQEAPGSAFEGNHICIPRKYYIGDILKKYKEVKSCINNVTPTEKLDGIDSILEERQKTHGDFRDHAYYTQAMKELFRESQNFRDLTIPQREALDMIAHKIGRILAGNPNVADHWDDIAGYAKLVSRLCTK